MECEVGLLGGLGYIGLHTAEELAGRGARFVVLARKRSLARMRDVAERIERLGGRILVGESIGPDVVGEAGCDSIVYLAGKPGGRREIVWEAHAGLLQRIMPALEETRPRLVYVSSIAVTADLSKAPPGSTVVEEEPHLSGGGRFETYHSESKAEGERLVASYRGRWAILRPGLVLGGRNPHPEAKILGLLCRLRLHPYSPYAPTVHVARLAGILVDAALEGRFDGRWVNVVESRGMRALLAEICRRGGLSVDVTRLLALGKFAGKGSPLRLAWSIISKKVYYRSKWLSL